MAQYEPLTCASSLASAATATLLLITFWFACFSCAGDAANEQLWVDKYKPRNTQVRTGRMGFFDHCIA
jgi:hypothetical protein